MQRITTTKRLPQQVLRVCKLPNTTTTNPHKRTMSLFSTRTSSPFFGEFAPMFRLMDDYASHVATRDGSSGNSPFKSLKTFQPKFDVKETKETYELHGELPGIDQKNVSIEFTDPQTLTIKGRTEYHREEGTRPSGLLGAGSTTAEQGKITAEGEGSAYHKPSVEEEGKQTTSSSSEEQQVEKSSSSSKSNGETSSSRYWVSERSVGEFARTFAFPTPVNQENCKASLKDGILSIVIPKAAAPVSRRVQIE